MCGVKLRAFCDDVVFCLKLAPWEIDRGPLFCLEVLPMATSLADEETGRVGGGNRGGGAAVGVGGGGRSATETEEYTLK